ncbi:MAG: tRNA (guanosine(18)-2'-O)-methyltransferase [Cellvibrionales bacterium UBA7375]|nr:MAG: tRNA (guanosine(18)-2'-O)-methyltransferase [Cellvibrionales bacterium UBA7375]
MTAARYSKIIEVLNQRQPDLAVVTDSVHKGKNLSAIIRTCDAVGVLDLYSVSENDFFGAHTGTTVGAHKWLNISLCKTISEPLEKLKSSGHQIVAAEVAACSKDYREVDYTLPTVLIMGAEIEGISQQAQPYIDHSITVPMMGMVESFNVSVAAAIILSEARRQRENAGYYDNRRLDDKTFNKYLFEWMQPVLAQYCQKHQLDYPELDEEGDVADPNWHQQAIGS